MTIKKMFLFPAAAMVLLLAAFFVGLGAAGADKADVAIYIVIALSCLMPFCLHVISLVGSLRKSASMLIVGSCIVLFMSFLGNVVVAAFAQDSLNTFKDFLVTGGATKDAANAQIALPVAMVWIFFGMTGFAATLLLISGIISIGKKGKNSLLLVSSILAIFFYLGFVVSIIYAYALVGKTEANKGLFLVFCILYSLSIFAIIADLLVISLLGFKGELPEEKEEELPGLTHTPKHLKLSKDDPVEEIQRWKKLLDSGAITQEEYDAKKAEILGK